MDRRRRELARRRHPYMEIVLHALFNIGECGESAIRSKLQYIICEGLFIVKKLALTPRDNTRRQRELV